MKKEVTNEKAALKPVGSKLPADWFQKKRPFAAANHSAAAANSERGQTPDWIHQIFHVARRGNLLNLVINLGCGTQLMGNKVRQPKLNSDIGCLTLFCFHSTYWVQQPILLINFGC